MLVRKPTTPKPQYRPPTNLRSVRRTSYGGGTISMADICDDRSSARRRNLLAQDRRSSRESDRSGCRTSIVSKSGGSKRIQGAARRISICSDLQRETDYHKQDKLSSGWQTRYDKVTDRVAALFNSWTMSDVVFHVGNRQIPGHKFILGCASPVLFTQCAQSNPLRFGSLPGHMPMSASGTCTPRSQSSKGGSVAARREKGDSVANDHARIVIEDYPFDAFFEFVKFIYTDDVTVTLANVKYLVLLADVYKVYRLGDLCFQFLRSAIHGESVLRVLEVMRILLTRACVCLWKGVIERNRTLVQFRELNMAERREALQALNAASTIGGLSRASSRIQSARHSVASSESGMSSKSGSMYTSKLEAEDEYGDAADEDQLNDQLMGRSSKDSRQKSHQLYSQIVSLSEELNSKCWKCVSECTDAVLGCNVWTLQPLNIVKEILRLEVVNVPEIALFRALVEWAEKRCREQGLALLPENRIKVIGDDALQLVRFPRMSIEQIMWEVVPTGVLDFKDLETLQIIVCNRSSAVGRFNGEPRQAPIVDMLKQTKPNDAKASIAAHEIGEKRTALAGKTPVYHTAANDEVDALLGSQLLRFHVDRCVDEHANDLAAAEAGISGSGETTRAVLLADPSIAGPDAQEDVRQTSRQLMPMLLHAGNWLSQESMEERQMVGQETEVTPVNPRSQNEVTYTSWGDMPGPHDFKRVARGLYSFRGNRLLEMAIEGGEAVVYEAEDRDEDDLCEEVLLGDIGGNQLWCLQDLFGEDLEGLSEEAIRREYGLTKEGNRTKVPLGAFLCRQ